MERLTDEQINKFADDRLWGGSKDPARAIRQLQAERDALIADNARLREAARALHARCFSGDFYTDYDEDWTLLGNLSAALGAS